MLCHRMSEPVPSTIASATELVVQFGNQVVLDHASVTFLEGERVGLVGRNGSGKSTFLQIAAGVMAPDAGELNRRRDLVIGYMPQMFELDENATVHANILSWCTARSGSDSGIRKRSARERAERNSARSDRPLRRMESRVSDQEPDYQPARTRCGARGFDLVRRREASRRALPRAAGAAGFPDSR